MSVSISVEWPGSTDDQQSDHPGFYNDDHMWANWMVAVIGDSKLVRLLDRIGVKVLLCNNTANLPTSEIGWATPAEFEMAATKLQNLIAAKDPKIKSLIEVYRKEWERLIGEERDETAEEWFIRDLNDVSAIAQYAQSKGAKVMTLGYYW